MPSGITKRVKNRKTAVLELLADGCKPTTYIKQKLGTTYEMAYYVLTVLETEGYVKHWNLGNTSVWCLNDDDYNDLINTILQEIRRIVETHNLRFVYPIRLYRLVLKDHKTLTLLAKLVPVNNMNSAVLSLLNHLLRLIYGEPYTKGKKTVYFVAKSGIKPPNN
jgi:hypothetical protein